MKVYLLAALTADGFIARHTEHAADWTSPEDKKFFVTLTKESGIMIMGRKTFDTIGRSLPGRKTIVYTRDTVTLQSLSDVETTSEPPAILLERLEASGAQSVVICGGSAIYSLFMKSGLVSDVYLTIEPIFFGQGVTLFHDTIDFSLELLETRQLNKSTLLNHYAVRSS